MSSRVEANRTPSAPARPKLPPAVTPMAPTVASMLTSVAVEVSSIPPPLMLALAAASSAKFPVLAVIEILLACPDIEAPVESRCRLSAAESVALW